MLRLPRLLVLVLLLLVPAIAHAQEREPALSANEIEKLRDTAQDPVERIFAFMVFLDDRTKAIDKLEAGKRRPGREEDVHDAMEQFTSIAADLDDNLDDYRKRHLDARKVIPKLLAACDRWQTALKSAPDDAAYKVARVLALEALGDVRESAKQLLEEQKVYFLAHPPGKVPDAKTRPES